MSRALDRRLGRQRGGGQCAVRGCWHDSAFVVPRTMGAGARAQTRLVGYCAEHYAASNQFRVRRAGGITS